MIFYAYSVNYLMLAGMQMHIAASQAVLEFLSQGAINPRRQIIE